VDVQKLEAFGWPASRVGEAVAALVRRSGLQPASTAAVGAKTLTPGVDIGAWVEWKAKLLGCEAEAIEAALANLEKELAVAYPALLQVSDSLYLAVLKADRRWFRVLAADLTVRRVSLSEVAKTIRHQFEGAHLEQIELLLDEAQIPKSRRSGTAKLLAGEQFEDKRFDRCWIFRTLPGATPLRWLRAANALRNGAELLMAHTAQYLLWLASWAILGRLSFEGRLDRGWLVAWALFLMTLAPFRVLTTRLQGMLAIGVGGILKRRLLCGAMQLGPEEMRHCGIGSFLAQVLEAESVETLALSGGVAGVLALIELVISAFVLGRFSLVLFAWCVLAALLAWRLLIRYQHWTDTRMEMTQDLIESMVGHRTRLAQQLREEWHEAEDQALDGYLEKSKSVDGAGAWFMAAVPRGWLVAGLACLVPAIVSQGASDTGVALVLGGVLLAWTAFKRLTGSFADIVAAWIAWKRIAPLFHAAARPERLGELVPDSRSGEPSRKIVEADRLSFRYRKESNPALQACSLAIRRGERILLEGPSGGGKTTFASLLSGMRQPDSGLLLVNGLDRHTLGDKRWHEQVAAAPQFHENHILTETFAFNLLMGRRWPPTQKDVEEAEGVCRELGLADLLDRMPSGMLQMVGEGGWQLSHGEKSRVYIARALLQNAGLVILDESFAALDPENLRTALECTLRRAETLLVIAHP
jgi:ATP-binding cassette, subfamily B, bacterial